MKVRPEPSVSPQDCGAGASGAVIPWNVAAAKSIAAVIPLSETERVDLFQARGRVLGLEASAVLPSPPFDMSAMDGYGVRFQSLLGPAPWRIRIQGRIAPGDALASTGDGTWRVLTGARMPDDLDAVVMQEHCEVDGDHIILRELPAFGRHIRKAGEDVKTGDILLESGVALTSRMLGLLAGQGSSRIDVIRKVRIGLVSTGSELVEPGKPRADHQIFNTNRVMLRTALDAHPWVETVDFGIVTDDRRLIATTLREAAKHCDALITTGRVSAGDADHIAGAIFDEGGSFDLMKVAMRPGKPLKVGKLNGRLFFGLPGNPNAALVTFRMIALPALRRLAGLKVVDPTWQPATANFDYDKLLGRTEFVPVSFSTAPNGQAGLVKMLGRGSTASLRSLADADGIALLTPQTSRIKNGDTILYEPILD